MICSSHILEYFTFKRIR